MHPLQEPAPETTPAEPGVAVAASAEAPPLPSVPQDAAPAAIPSPGSPAAPAELPKAVGISAARDVHGLDWAAVRQAADPRRIRAWLRPAVEGMEALLDSQCGPGLLFDAHRSDAQDRAIRVAEPVFDDPPWIIGDLHGDLLALEAALAFIARDTGATNAAPPRIIFLGDLFDDEGQGLEVVLRVFALILQAPTRVCVLAGNHEDALSFDGTRFASGLSPGDFAEFLNANLVHEWIERAGKLVVRLFAQAPRALFFPDGLLVTHGGFPLIDLHPRLAETRDWNDPACLADFVWTRAHPTARRKLPNRFTRGSQFGHEDFAAFCALSGRLGRPVTHMVRGHDHVEDRYAIYSAYAATPVLTTVALSRRLPRESFGARHRVPTLARCVEGALPQVYRLHVPTELIDALYPEPPPEHQDHPPQPEPQP